jgi:hexokinase
MLKHVYSTRLQLETITEHVSGTGTNACYVESQKNAEMFDEEDRGSGKVLINCEWGAFGDDGSLDFLRTEYDRDVDEHTVNPGRQL